MRLPVMILATAALAGCGSRGEQTIANQFDQTSNAIENSAAVLESETENAARAATSALEREADEYGNRVEAMERAATTNTTTGNTTTGNRTK
jgi:hypothetical protein